MHVFDYRFLKQAIPGSFLETTGIIYDLRAREQLRKNEHPESFAALRRSAIIDSVTGSNAIEGIRTTGKRMRELLTEGVAPQSHDETEILGYRHALGGIYDNYQEMPLTEALIRHLHAQVFFGTSAEAGQYKQEDNWIQERDSDGNLRIRFVPVSASDTPEAMRQMLSAYMEARQESDINRLLLDLCLVQDSLCIHPFTDGNGRVSRLIMSLLLLRNNFDITRYISVDKMIHRYQYEYYEALHASSDGWHDSGNSYLPFMTYMLQILYRCYKVLDEKFIDGEARKLPKGKQVEAVLRNAFVPVSKQELQNRLPDISTITIERTLSRLLKEGVIEKIGTFKDARYRAL